MNEIKFICSDCGGILFSMVNTSSGKPIGIPGEVEVDVQHSQGRVEIGLCKNCVDDIPDCEECDVQDDFDLLLKRFEQEESESEKEILLLERENKLLVELLALLVVEPINQGKFIF